MKVTINTKNWGVMIAALAVLVTMALAGAGVVSAWGEQKARVGHVTDRQITIERSVRELGNRINDLAVKQGETKATVDAIKEQQGIDRDHLDSRLDDIVKAIKQKP